MEMALSRCSQNLWTVGNCFNWYQRLGLLVQPEWIARICELYLADCCRLRSLYSLCGKRCLLPCVFHIPYQCGDGSLSEDRSCHPIFPRCTV